MELAKGFDFQLYQKISITTIPQFIAVCKYRGQTCIQLIPAPLCWPILLETIFIDFEACFSYHHKFLMFLFYVELGVSNIPFGARVLEP